MNLDLQVVTGATTFAIAVSATLVPYERSLMQSFERAWEKLQDQPVAQAIIPAGAAATVPTSRVARFHVIGGSLRKLAVVINDLHVPFQDKRVLGQVLRFIREVQPDTVILNGDILDAYSLSTFVKSSKRRVTLADEINAAKTVLKDIREAAPNAVVHFTEGNHETRLRRYLDSNSPALATLPCLRWESLLGLDDLGIQWHGTEGFKLNRSFLVLHGDRVSKHAGATARMEFERHLVSGISGHTHRAGRHDVVGHSKDFHWVENGCLCELNPEYISGKPNWQQAISLVEYNRDRTHVRLIPILGRKLIVDGVNYS